MTLLVRATHLPLTGLEKGEKCGKRCAMMGGGIFFYRESFYFVSQPLRGFPVGFLYAV